MPNAKPHFGTLFGAARIRLPLTLALAAMLLLALATFRSRLGKRQPPRVAVSYREGLPVNRYLFPLIFLAVACNTEMVVVTATPTHTPAPVSSPEPALVPIPTQTPLPPVRPLPSVPDSVEPTPTLPPLPLEVTEGMDALVACAGEDSEYWLAHGPPTLTAELVECLKEELQ